MLNMCCAPTKAFLPKPALEIRLPLLDEVSRKLLEALKPSRGFSHMANMLAPRNTLTCAVCYVLLQVFHDNTADTLSFSVLFVLFEIWLQIVSNKT